MWERDRSSNVSGLTPVALICLFPTPFSISKEYHGVPCTVYKGRWESRGMRDRGEAEKESKKVKKKNFQKGKYQGNNSDKGALSLEPLTIADRVKPDRVFLIFWILRKENKNSGFFCVSRILFYLNFFLGFFWVFQSSSTPNLRDPGFTRGRWRGQAGSGGTR